MKEATLPMCAVTLLLVILSSCGRNQPVTRVAVAANFEPAARALLAGFEAQQGAVPVITVGSTGALYAQIRAGAPFGLFLAADRERPRRLEADGLAVPDSRATYASGRLLLWSADPGLVPADGANWLRRNPPRRLALAQPELAPYGRAAVEVLAALGVAERLEPRLVFGANAGQTHALVATGNAEAGLLAASLVDARSTAATAGSRWSVPHRLHGPIEQQLVLLTGARDQPLAGPFATFVLSAEGKAIIRRHGYGTD